MFFLIVWEYGFCGRKTEEMECPFRHVILSTYVIPLNLDLDYLAEIEFAGLFRIKLLALHIIVFFGRKSLCITDLRDK